MPKKKSTKKKVAKKKSTKKTTKKKVTKKNPIKRKRVLSLSPRQSLYASYRRNPEWDEWKFAEFEPQTPVSDREFDLLRMASTKNEFQKILDKIKYRRIGGSLSIQDGQQINALKRSKTFPKKSDPNEDFMQSEYERLKKQGLV